MTLRRVPLIALGLVLIVVLVIIALSLGRDPYLLRVPLDNASGLKSGSSVIIGGVESGQVELTLDEDDQVIAELRLDPAVAPIGKDTEVSIAAQNFLGQKRAVLTRGDVSEPAPSGYSVPRSNVTTPTDLDQVLGVLDADTRARATILLNEAGGAVFGRRVDIGRLIKEFPIGLEDGTRVLRALRADDNELRALVERTDRLMVAAANKRQDLGQMVDVVGRVASNISTRRDELRSTLAEAPGALSTLQGFLAELEATTEPLEPAARQIEDTAGPLARALDEVEPFGDAAMPALRTASDVAPSLTRLGDEATPVIERAGQTVDSLNELAKALPPIGSTLDGSSDNIIVILENWSRAIQFRDGLGHVFRGEASFTPDAFTSVLSRLAPDEPENAQERRAGPSTAKPAAPKRAPDRSSDESAAGGGILEDLPRAVLVDLPRSILDKLERGRIDELPRAVLEDLPKSVLGQLTGPRRPASGNEDAGRGARDGGAKALLDFLLGP